MNKSSRIFVCGHAGLIGSAVKRRLEQDQYTPIITTRSQLDLQDWSSVVQFFEKMRPEYVVLAAGRVGGIVENQTSPADFMEQNIAIQLNVLKAARKVEVKKLILFGSSCMYPRECAQPMSEDVLLSARLEPTSLPYAIAKLTGTYMCLAYNKQYGDKRFIPVIPNSAYGPNDNFQPQTGHVLSALMSRFHQAKINGAERLTLWGSGSPCREFIHADDIADACLHLFQHDLAGLDFPLNLGVGYDISIKDLATKIASVVGYTGALDWDTGKPDGAPRKLLDSSRLRSSGWVPKTDFDQGLRDTYAWYLQHVPSSISPELQN
jgi:GDP-L-fucose synthase